MAIPSQSEILAVLSTIQDPDLGRDVVSLGMIKDLAVAADGRVGFTFELTTPACPVRDRFHTMAEELVGALPGVTAVDVKMTANVRQAFANRPAAGQMLPGVKQTIAVASGKGGVGKSTVAVNLAASLVRSGARVGLLDADIYGPSIPGMTGVHEQPRVVEKPNSKGELQKRLVPLEAWGIKMMSIGFIAGESTTAMVWRGPMVSRAIEQMMQDVDWGELDYLVIDLPPGTGDASLTIGQAIPLTGVTIVATPQDVAVDIAVKALQMFRQLNVTVLGLIENMSWFTCPDCGKQHHPFGHGGAERAAQRLGVPFLGSLPLETEIRIEADKGTPIVVAAPESEGARAFTAIASQLAARTSIQSFRQLPVLNIR
jgi:ATP-binding protein involved in chromosome partitioning